MKKIFIVCLSPGEERIFQLQSSLEKFGVSMFIYGLFESMTKNPEGYMEEFMDSLKTFSPCMTLWTFTDWPIELLTLTRESVKCLFAIFPRNESLFSLDPLEKEKIALFDLVISSRSEFLSLTTRQSQSTQSLFLFSPCVREPLFPEPTDFACDVSFCVGDLYDNEGIYSSSLLSRRKVIDKIISLNVSFHLYGPSYLFLHYPQNYKGFASGEKLRKIVKTSRININTHVSHDSPLNSRVSVVLGSGGLLLTDATEEAKRLVAKEKGVQPFLLFSSSDDLEMKIREILREYSKFEHTKRRGYELSDSFSWDKWSTRVYKWISLSTIDEKWYRDFYSLPDNVSSPKDYFIEFGLSKKHSSSSFSICPNFDSIRYGIDTGLKKSKSYLFWHWSVESRLSKYLSSSSTCKKDFKSVLNQSKIDPETWFEINECFQWIQRGEKRKKGLLKLGRLSRENKGVDLEKLLSSFFETIRE